MGNHHELELLAELGALDADLDGLARRRAALEEDLQQTATAESQAYAELERARAAVEANRTQERTLQRKLEDYRTRHRGAIQALETGAGDPEAAQRQVDQCVAILDDTETALLETFEQADALAGQVEKAEQALAEASEAHANAERDAPDKRREIETEQTELRDQRVRVVGSLPAETRQRYELLKERRGTAVAKVVNKACKACRMSIPPHRLSELKRGLIQTCSRCGRWLVLDA